MVGPVEVGGAIAGLRAMKDILQGIKGALDAVKTAEIKAELLGLLIDALESASSQQEAKAALAQRVAELEKRIADFEDWNTQSERYELADTGKGALAYRLKEGMEAGEPPHWICPSCYDQRKKSILHPEHQEIGRMDFLRCHPCGHKIMIRGPGRSGPSVDVVRR